MICCPCSIQAAQKIMDAPKLTLRVELGGGRALGPGKIRLLEAIEETGSISQAGRKLGMSYRRAWLLVDDMNHCFEDGVIEAQPGGAHGGGTTLTPFGRKLVKRYRAVEAVALKATQKHFDDLAPAPKRAKRSGTPTTLKRPLSSSGAHR
jgi:molybdate transport system regulatory protein